jgi:hypothetical protein
MIVRRIVALAVVTGAVLTAQPAQAAGETSWTKIYAGPAGSLDTIVGIAVDPRTPYWVWVVGTSDGGTTHNDIVTMMLDAYTGKKIWARRYDGPAHGSDQAVAIAATTNFSEVAVTGYSEATAGTQRFDAVTIAYQYDTGQRRWADRFSMSSHSSDVPVDLAAVDGRSYVLIGGTDHGGLVAYDSAGSRTWHRTVTDRSLTGLVGLEELGGYLFAVGNVSTSTGTAYLSTGFKELDGSLVWSKRYDGPGHGGAVATDASVSGTILYVTGTATDGAKRPITTIGYFPHDGARFWLHTIAAQAPGNLDADPKIAGAPDGTAVAVAATSYLDGVGTFLTREYGADGSTTWTARVNGPEDVGIVHDIAVDPNGNVAVTGRGATTASTPGPLTVRYSSTGVRTFTATVAPATGADVAWVTVFDGFGSHVLVGSRWNDDMRVDSLNIS